MGYTPGGDESEARMYIRTRQEALDALAETLQYPERRSQLIDLTVKIILCLNPDPRTLLADCQAALIEGGLEEMARRRRDLLETAVEEELILIVDPEENRLYDGIGRSLDALRAAGVACEVFPVLAQQFEPWEFVRAILTNAEGVRECVVGAVRLRNTPEEVDARIAGQKKLLAWLEQARPAWRDRAEPLRSACAALCGTGPQALDLFTAMTADDERATRALDLLERSPAEAVDYLTRAREITQTIRRLEAEDAQPGSETQRRVA